MGIHERAQWDRDMIDGGTVGRKGTGMGIHWDLGTMGWGHNRIWHSGMERDRDRDTLGLGHNGMGA